MKKGSNNEHMNNIIVTTTSVNFSFMACVDGLYPPKIVEGGTGKKFQRISITTRRREAQKKITVATLSVLLRSFEQSNNFES